MCSGRSPVLPITCMDVYETQLTWALFYFILFYLKLIQMLIIYLYVKDVSVILPSRLWTHNWNPDLNLSYKNPVSISHTYRSRIYNKPNEVYIDIFYRPAASSVLV
jgi:hypothetical protein